MTTRGVRAPPVYLPSVYWEDRARRFAAEGDGLAAVCAYGMPEFYNRAIDFTQRLALSRWLQVRPGTRVLDVGCGVGRWSRLLASRGAEVTGIDLSTTMIAEANRRARAAGLSERCRFLVQNSALLDIGERFDLVLSVTVLQHILDCDFVRAALRRMSGHLGASGRIVLLEAAPARAASHCDSTVFQARHRDAYLRMFGECGLQVRAITGVDPAPFRTRLLPHLARLPRHVSIAALALATAMSVPIDALFGRLAVAQSWHAVFVLQALGDGEAACA
ncbi:MAG: SAM-dependent methyltransferase [Steroidobacterales bacterium]